ncbi:MAG TPA: alpha/beta fold hydrolase, partial [Tahibacter sp.]|uniref:alpha/beta fold hydrolase n=1 Tax=Tahibacter sp. TaxID=2056211 RepID=UPI002D1D770F
MRAWIYLIGLLTLCGARLVAAATWQSCHLSGHGDALRCTAMAVPRDYADAAKGSIDLHIALAPAVRAQAEPDPVFVLAGGPGQAGSDIVMLLDTALAKARASRDIVFIDPRGTGRSGRLNCDDGSDPLTRGDEALRDATLACLRGFGESLLTYSTESAAEDLDRVRIALGAERINLWGGSYGTRLAQVYAQRHPAQVRSLILDGVVDADLIIGADDLAFQTALDALLQRCAGDADCARAFPSLANDLDALLRNLDAAAATATLPHPRSGRPVAAPVSRLRLLQTIKHLLYSPRSAARVPYLITRARAGDWRPLLAVQASSVDVAVAPPAGGLLMTIACREDWPRLDASRRAEQANSRTFGGRSLAEF